MLWDQIIYWMSHVGEGSWAGFKRAVASLATVGTNPKDAARLLRLRFSDLAIGEFFIDGSERWQAFGPLLVSSPHDPHVALLAGARTPGLLEKLRKGAAAADCQVFDLVVEGLFTNTKVHGRDLRAVADAAGIEYERDIGRRLALSIPTLEEERERRQSREPPRNWDVASFDYNLMAWRAGPEHGPTLEMTSKYEQRAYFVRWRDGRITELPKRFAVYGGAAVQGVALAHYDSRTREFTVPAAAPLPEPCARAACLAGGRPSVVRSRQVLYENVPARLAGVILASLEQPAADTFSCPQG